MGFAADETMFREQDAASRGYREGREGAESVLFSMLSEVLGVDREALKDLVGLDVGARVVALEVVSGAVGDALDAAVERKQRFDSDDPSVVAGILHEEQTPHSGEMDERGYFSSLDYAFTTNQADGSTEVRSDRYTPFSYLTEGPLSGEWVGNRLRMLGVERDEAFCEQVGRNIAVLTFGEENG